MPRALPSNPDLIVEDPAPLERFAGFPHQIVPFPVDDLLSFGGFSSLPPPTGLPLAPDRPRPSEPESAL